jgi:integrase
MRDAKDERAKVLRQDREGLLVSDRKLTTGKYLEEWWTWRTQQHETPLRATTQRSYRQHLDEYLIPLLGGVRLAELRAAHIEKAFQRIRSEHPKQASATRLRIYATLRSALKHAVRSKLLPVSPCDAVNIGFRTSRPRPSVWEPEELGAFLDHLDGLDLNKPERRLGPLYHFAAFTGLRRGEVCGLRWADMDLERRTVTVTQQAVVVGHRVEFAAPKTKAGEQRVVALDAATVAALRTWRAQQAAERLAWGSAWTDSGLVFTREDGTGWHPELVTKAFPRLVKAAGLPTMRLHDLRHLSASLQIAAGVPLAIVSKRLGHSSIAITADTYGHLLGEANSQAAEASAALVPRRTLGASRAVP